MQNKRKTKKRERAKLRVRKKVYGTAERPRLTVYRSLKEIYAQIINDDLGKTLVAFSSFTKDLRGKLSGKKKTEVGFEVGVKLAEKALAAGLKDIVFDKNGYAYHGRVKSLAEGARKGGLNF